MTIHRLVIALALPLFLAISVTGCGDSDDAKDVGSQNVVDSTADLSTDTVAPTDTTNPGDDVVSNDLLDTATDPDSAVTEDLLVDSVQPDLDSSIQPDQTSLPYRTWYDAGSDLHWLVKTNHPVLLDWVGASEYCETLSAEGQGDWRLPSLAELKGLIAGCPATMPGGDCPIGSDCLASDCWESPCDGCTSDEGPDSTGRYWNEQVPGSLPQFWSGSLVSDKDQMAWWMDFSSAAILYTYTSDAVDSVLYEFGVFCVY